MKITWAIVGVAVTALLVVVPPAILILEKGAAFRFMEPNEWGDFLAGIAAPAALVWLIVGYFQHSKEIALQQKELQRQVEETAQLVKQSERHAGATEELVQLTRDAKDGETLRRLKESSPRFQYYESGGTASRVDVSIRNVGGMALGVDLEDDLPPHLEFSFGKTIGTDEDSRMSIHFDPVVQSPPDSVRFSLVCNDRFGYRHFFDLKLEFRGPAHPPILWTVAHQAFEHVYESTVNSDGITSFGSRLRMIPLPPDF